MTYVKTEEDVRETFPHGALMVQDNESPISLTSLTVTETERGPVLLGWSPPSKDFTVELRNVLNQKGGWLCFSRGKRIVLRPLTEAQGNINESRLEELG